MTVNTPQRRFAVSVNPFGFRFREAVEQVRCRKLARWGEKARRPIRKAHRSPLASVLKHKSEQKVEVVDVFVALSPSWIL